MHVESPLPENIWIPNLMLGELSCSPESLAMRLGTDAFRPLHPPTDKNKALNKGLSPQSQKSEKIK